MFAAADLFIARLEGPAQAERRILQGAILLALCGFTWIFTRPVVPRDPVDDSGSPGLQLAITIAVVLISAAVGALSSGIVPGLPGWGATALRSGVGQLLLYAGMPSLALLPFGVPRAAIHLRISWRASLTAGSIWLAAPIVSLERQIASAGLGEIPMQLASAFFQNGFSEEFLFRGLLLTRLARFLTMPWALAVQSIVFGLWHFGADEKLYGDPAQAIAHGIVSQAAFGYAMGFLALRTRSLVVPSLYHAMADVVA